MRIIWTLLIVFSLGSGARASDWTVGSKTLLYIRFDFSDRPGAPVADGEIEQILAGVDQYFLDNSYGLLKLKSTATPTLRMPKLDSFYDGNPDDQAIIRDARAAAKKAGFDTDRYTLDIVAWNTPPNSGGGSELAAIGGKGARILNNFRDGITMHAIGHNLGLPHSRYWQTDDGTVLGHGTMVEYGDPYDPMGGGGSDHASPNHLDIRSKAILGWLGTSGLTNVKASGTYRLYAQDLSGSDVRGLHIDRDSDTDYWIEFRQLITDNSLMMNGVRILRGYKHDNALDLLNMNPAAPGGSHDAPLLLGHTFADTDAGIYVTPVALNKTQPPSMDVAVNLGKPLRHEPLTIEVKNSAKGAISANEAVDFTASIGNPSHAPIVCAWDFGDGSFASGVKVSHAWKLGNRDYVVRASVSDLWGTEIAHAEVIPVGRPVVGARVSGKVSDGTGPLEGVRVNVTPDVARKNVRYGQETTLSDSDGFFAVVGLERGMYMIRLIRPGYYILPVKLECPTAGPLAFRAVKLDDPPRTGGAKTTLHIHATIDGTDELRITRGQATWKHLTWDWPTNIKLNGVAMDPHVVLPNSGSTVFLPRDVNGETAVLRKVSGRGTVDLYRQGDALVITFDDPQGGPGDYDLDIEMETGAP